MNTITTRAMKRHSTGTGFFKQKQPRKVQKGIPNGRYVGGRHSTKGGSHRGHS